MSFLTSKTAISNKFTTSDSTNSTLAQQDAPTTDETISQIIDTRPLAIRLAEAQQKKDDEYAAIAKIKSTIRGLDEEELEFLDGIKQHQKQLLSTRNNHELQELEEFKRKQESLNPIKRKVFPKAPVPPPVAVDQSPPMIILCKKRILAKTDVPPPKKQHTQLVDYDDSD